MSNTILDAVNAKLATMMALAAATDQKVATERDLRAAQVSSLQDRVTTLENNYTLVTAELGVKQAMIDNLTGELAALQASLTTITG